MILPVLAHPGEVPLLLPNTRDVVMPPPLHCVIVDHGHTFWGPQLDYRKKRLKQDYGSAHSNEIINKIAGPMRSGDWTKDATFFQHDGASVRN